MRRLTWSGGVLVALLTSAALASAAQAASTWQCSASSVTSSLVGNPTANPVTSTGSPCVSNATGLDSLPTPLGLPANAISAQTASATTMASPGDEIPARQGVAAIGRVENLAIQLPPGSGTTLGIRAANAQATGICVAGTPVFDGQSEALGATLGGQEVPLEQAAQQIAAGLAPLGDALDLKVDEQVRTATRADGQRAAHQDPQRGRDAGARRDRRPGARRLLRRRLQPQRPGPRQRRQRAAARAARRAAPTAAPCSPTASAAAPAGT